MAQSFFFYDLETSSLDPRRGRIMQFAGQRTTLQLEPAGEPLSVLLKLAPDVLPDPHAVFQTGIAPQIANKRGISEAAFIEVFLRDVWRPDTIFVGYNSIRFDDEFMRNLFYRNFADAYEWQWRDGCSRWDLLDVMRCARALRPEGITWPVDEAGLPTTRLAALTAANGLPHARAHDALSDVQATIALARLLRDGQPKLFEYLLNLRQKQRVAALAESGEPFAYTSGAYPPEYHKTTLVLPVLDEPNQGAWVFDLRYDPQEYIRLDPAALAAQLGGRPGTGPVKLLRYNRCPAVAPLRALDAAAAQRLQLDTSVAQARAAQLSAVPAFAANLREALQMSRPASGPRHGSHVDERLYDGFLGDADRRLLPRIRGAAPETLLDFVDQLADERLQALLPLYKARNYPEALSPTERSRWEGHCLQRLTAGNERSPLARFHQALAQLRAAAMHEQEHALLADLHAYADALLPLALV